MLKTYENFKDFIVKHSHFFSLVVLALFCYLFLFFNLGAYSLIDVDETRYAAITKAMFSTGDWVTPFLNGEPFLEKPPLLFWLGALSYKIFGNTSDFVSRFPTAMFAVFTVFFTYFFARKALGQAFGLISAMILLSSVWFLLFSHVVILDIGFLSLVTASIYSVLLILFCREQNKKYCWWSGYIFMALAVLMKGLIGIIIPVLVVFFCLLATRKLKEIFKPVNWLVGIPLFLLITIPWHYQVWLAHKQVWIHDYIMVHHFARFTDSEGIGRKQPFLFYVPILFAGFAPWTMSMVSAMISGIKVIIRDFRATKLIKPIFSTDTNDKKILVTMSIYFLVVFLFFSISSSKIPTYILVALPPLAMLCGYYWWGYISYGKFTRGIVISTVITVIMFILAGLAGANLGFFISLPTGIDTFRIISVCWAIVLSLIALMCLLTKNRALLFLTNVFLVLGATLIITSRVLGFILLYGQDELVSFANITKAVPNTTLVTFDFSSKYSILNVRPEKVYFIHNLDYDKLKKVEETALKEKSPLYVIVRNDDFKNFDERFVDYITAEKGEKYTLLIHKRDVQQKRGG